MIKFRFIAFVAILIVSLGYAYGAYTITDCRVVVGENGFAKCAENEIVIDGGGDCGNSSLSRSSPLPSLRGWYTECANGAISMSTMARCCSSEGRTTLDNVIRINSTQPLFQQCSLVSEVQVTFDSHLATSTSSCPGTQYLLLTGGASCPAGWSITASYALSDGSWHVECARMTATTDSLSLLSVVESISLCCYAPLQCTQHVLDSSNRPLLVPEPLAYCSNSEVLVSTGVECMDYSSLHQTALLAPYDLNLASISVCSPMHRSARVSYQCCPVESVAAFPSAAHSYCAAPVLPVQWFGQVVSNMSHTPSALHAMYRLHCDHGFYSVGASEMECQPNGQWSNNGRMGKCVALDTNGCKSVRATSSSSINGSTILACPSDDWILLNVGATCSSSFTQANISLHIGESVSLSSWRSRCVDSSTNTTFAAELVTGVCCPRTEANLFGSCRARAHCSKNEEELVLSQSEHTSTVCCPVFSHAHCHPPQQEVSSRAANDVIVSVLRDFCPIDEVLLRLSGQPTAHGLSYVAELAVSSNTTQRWSYLTVVSNHSRSPYLPSRCCRTTPVCTWSSALSTFADAARTPQFWECSHNVTYFCKPGYQVQGSDSNSALLALQSSNIMPPECVASRCSSLENQLSPEVVLGSSFDYMGQSTPLRCASGLDFVDLNVSMVLIACLGDKSSGGLDWQPSPSSLVCPGSAVSNNGSRRLLQYGTSVNTFHHVFGAASFSHWFDDPYTLRLGWSMNGPDMLKLYNDPNVKNVAELGWQLTYNHMWPNDGFVDQDRSETAAYSGIVPIQGRVYEYNTVESILSTDSNNYIEGIQARVSFGITKLNFKLESVSSFDQLKDNHFLLRGMFQSDMCLGVDTNMGLLLRGNCDSNDPSFHWKTYEVAGRYLVQNIATGGCVSVPQAMSVDCDRFDESNWMYALILYDDTLARYLCARFFSTNLGDGTLRITKMNAYYSSAFSCVLGETSWHVNVNLLIASSSLVTVDVGSFLVKSPCGCDVINNPDGTPGNVTLHQQPGQKNDLFLSFTPQSLCNDEFEVFEQIGDDMVRVDVPPVHGYTFETYSSCKSTTVRTISVEDLTWDRTCQPRIFCLIALPKPVCVACLSEYIPNQTSPGITVCTKPTSPEFWFTVSGVVITGGGAAGISAPVSNVVVRLQVVPGNASNLNPVWSSDALAYMDAVTDNNGRYEVTISEAFADGPKQFYQVVGLPVKSHTYIDPQPMILSRAADSFQLVQVGVGSHVIVDIGMTESIVSQAQTQILVTSSWICPDLAGNTTDYRSVSCNQDNSYLIRMNAKVNIVNVSITSVKYSNSQSMVDDSETSTSFHKYEWDLPWNRSMLTSPLISSNDPVVGQSVFFNGTETITPYLLDATGFWLSPVTLANSITQLTYNVTSLVVPPTESELETLCAPVCDEAIIEPVIYISGSSPKVNHSVTLLNPLSGQVTKSRASVTSLTPNSGNTNSPVYMPSKAWFHVTLQSGISFSFRFSDIISVNATMFQMPKGAQQEINQTDSTVPLVIKVSALTLVEPYQSFEPITQSKLRISPALPATLTFWNASAVVVMASVGWTWSGSRIDSSIPVEDIPYIALTSDVNALTGTFHLIAAAAPDMCMSTDNSCVNGAVVTLKPCNSAASFFQMSNSVFTFSSCSSLVLDLKPGLPINQASLQQWENLPNHHQYWAVNSKSQIQSIQSAGQILVDGPPPPIAHAESAFLPRLALPLSSNVDSTAYDLISKQSLGRPARRLRPTPVYSVRSSSALLFDSNTGALASGLTTTASFSWSLWFNFNIATIGNPGYWNDAVPYVIVSAKSYTAVGQWAAGFTRSKLFLSFIQPVACGYSDALSDSTGNAVYIVPGGWEGQQNTWHHVAFVLDGPAGMSYIYLNGSLVATKVVSGFIAAQPVQFGGEDCLSYNWAAGGMQCIAGWDRPLTSDHVSQLYDRQTKPNSCNDLSDFVLDPSLPIPATHSNSQCVSVDPSVSPNFVGGRACLVDESIDVEQQWLIGVTGHPILPIAVNRTVVHQFEAANGYNQSPYGTAVIEFGQTMYFPLTWMDQSSVSVSGTVRVALSPLLPGVQECGKDQIVINAYALNDHTLQNPIATSVETDGSGNWALALPLHQDVLLVPKFSTHERDSIEHEFFPANITLQVREKRLVNITFVDITQHSLSVTLEGGLCGIDIGSITPILVLPGCNNRRFQLATPLSNLRTTYMLPASEFELIAYRSGENSSFRYEPKMYLAAKKGSKKRNENDSKVGAATV